MKLKNLLALAAVALGLNAWAQKDVTNQYIKNATLADGTNDWTVKNFNAPQKGNNTVGYASESYAGWGSLEITEYSMTQKITLPAGSYRLANYSFFRQGLNYNTDASKSLGFLKAGDKQVAIKTLGSISGTYYANSQTDGANAFDSKMYRNTVDFEIAEDGTEIEIGLVGTFDLKQSWCIAGMFELFDLEEDAAVDNPVDVTYLIKNPGFEYRNANGWDLGGVNFQYQGSTALPTKAGEGFAERWQSDALGGLSDSKFTQVVVVPAGMYRLSAIGQNVEQQNGGAQGSGMYFICGDERVEVTNNTICTTQPTLVSDGQLTIGVELDGCTGNWVSFDNFKLEYLGVDLSSLAANLATQREILANLDVTGLAPKYATLKNDALANTAGTYTTKKALNDATKTVTDAIGEISAAIELANAIKEVIDEYAPKVAALETAGQTSYAESNVTSAEYESAEEARTAINNAYIAAVKAQGVGGDITALVGHGLEPNDQSTEEGVWVGANKYVTEEYCPQSPGSPERYYDGPTTGTVIVQTISGLKKGSYEVTLKGGARYTPNRGFAGEGGLNRSCFFANDAIKSIEVKVDPYIQEGEMDVETLVCNVTEDGILKFGVQNIVEGANWFVCDVVSIKYISEDYLYVEPTLKVTEAQFATFVCPFDIELPEGVAAYTVGEVNGMNELVMEKVEGTLLANTPVVLYSEEPVEETYTGVSKAEGKYAKAGLLYGVYEESEIKEGYVLQKHEIEEDGEVKNKVAFFLVKEPIAVPAYRAYLSTKGLDTDSAIKMFSVDDIAGGIFDDDVPLAIGSFENLMSGKAVIFNANGVKQNKLQKGMNIIVVNGQAQKVFVK